MGFGLTRRTTLAAAMGTAARASSGTWKIGLAQISLSDELAENKEKILVFIRRAAAERHRVVVFPEGALTAATGPSQAEIDRCLTEIRDAAASGQIRVLMGGNSIPPGQSAGT